MNKEELINTLEVVKAEVEWEQPLTYAAAIDEAIKYIKALDKACKELAKLEKLFLDAGGYEEFNCSEERWKEWLLKDE